jgi:hypothetical protein
VSEIIAKGMPQEKIIVGKGLPKSNAWSGIVDSD